MEQITKNQENNPEFTFPWYSILSAFFYLPEFK